MPTTHNPVRVLAVTRRTVVRHLVGSLGVVLAPICNTSLNFFRHPIEGGCVLDFFSNEGKANIEIWYNNLLGKTRFKVLEYWKSTQGTFKHEFILVWLDKSTLCRFDRRPNSEKAGYALHGTKSEDRVSVIRTSSRDYKELVDQSEIIMSISLPQAEDVSLILDICYAIQAHPKAIMYSLLRYNCFFFSWTIVTAVARRACTWETDLGSEAAWNRIIAASVDISSASGSLNTPAENPSKGSFLPRLRSIFLSPQQKPVPTPTADEQLLSELGDIIKTKLSSYYPFIGRILHRLLLRSQLTSTLQRKIMHLIEFVLLDATLDAAERNAIIKAEEVVSLHHLTSKSLPHIRPIHTVRILSRQYRQPIPYPLLAREGIVMAASTASTVLIERSQCRDTKSIPKKPWEELWEKLWDSAWLQHWESSIQTQTTDTERAFIESISNEAKQEWKKTWETYAAAYNEHIATINGGASDALLKVLKDLDPGTLVIGEKAKSKWRRHVYAAKHITRLDAHPPFQEFIRDRMAHHFKMVDTYGFGTFEELLSTTETEMCEIWETALDRWEQVAMNDK